jgi:GntR family transcriptional regulator, transcriptional repressor for pyruvate dehydrogenase complex
MKFQPVVHTNVSVQIAEQIRSSILAGDFSPGDKLPPAWKLAKIFNVSLPSVRKALNILASAGVVMSYHGCGTVVMSLVTKSGQMLS